MNYFVVWSLQNRNVLSLSKGVPEHCTSPFSPSQLHSALTSPLSFNTEVILDNDKEVCFLCLLSPSLHPISFLSSSPSQDFHLYALRHASEHSQPTPCPNPINSNAPSTPNIWKTRIDRKSSGQGPSIHITAPDPNQAALA
jgi:hypothetical protein